MAISKLFALGSNGSGQLGTGNIDDSMVPQKCLFEARDFQSLPNNDKIAKIATGGNHTLVKFASGAVFAAGNNEDGQCGLPQTILRTSQFRKIVMEGEEGHDVRIFTDIAATWTASFLVEDGNKVHVLGSGPKGELGLGEGITKAPSKAVINVSEVVGASPKVGDISGGMNHVVILSSEGEAAGWGAARNGQLGRNVKEQRSVWRPKRIELPSKMSWVVTGRNYTIFSDGARATLLLGENKHLESRGTLGQFESLAAGWSSIYALSHGRVKAVGRSDRGQHPPEELPSLRMLAAGSEHCVALTTSGGAIAWGWGEHGNCGEPVDDSGNVAGRWNNLSVQLKESEVVSLVAAGCATSFIVVDSKD